MIETNSKPVFAIKEHHYNLVSLVLDHELDKQEIPLPQRTIYVRDIVAVLKVLPQNKNRDLLIAFCKTLALRFGDIQLKTGRQVMTSKWTLKSFQAKEGASNYKVYSLRDLV
jgi:hypothetical protein